MTTPDSKCSDALFRTPVEVPQPLHPFDVGQGLLFLGSCFAQHMGQRFADAELPVEVNPLGAIYNPCAIARVLQTEAPTQAVESPMGWHTWLSGTLLVRPSEAEALAAAGEVLRSVRQMLMRRAILC